MRNVKKETILSIIRTFRDLAFMLLGLSILSALLLSLVLVLFGSSWMREPLATCQAALRPVACESKAMTHR